MNHNTKTIIPEPTKELAPLELVILEFLEAEVDQRETDMFERLHIENVNHGFTPQKVHSRAKFTDRVNIGFFLKSRKICRPLIG